MWTPTTRHTQSPLCMSTCKRHKLSFQVKLIRQMCSNDHWESKTNCSFFNLQVSTKIACQTTADSSWRTTAYPAKWLLRNEHRNSILKTNGYRDLGYRLSHWSCCMGNLLQLITSTPRSRWWRVISMEFLCSFLLFNVRMYI